MAEHGVANLIPVSVGEGGVSPIIIKMTCDQRRGKSWKAREVWSAQKIGEQEVLITANEKSIIVYHRQ